jgi:heat shock protein HslJ
MALLTMLAVGCLSVEAPSSGEPSPESAASLVGTAWVAEDIDGRGVLEQAQSTLAFAGLKRIAGRAGCNQFFGSLELGAGTLRLKPEGTTRMACSPAIMEQEVDSWRPSTPWPHIGDRPANSCSWIAAEPSACDWLLFLQNEGVPGRD